MNISKSFFQKKNPQFTEVSEQALLQSVFGLQNTFFENHILTRNKHFVPTT